MFIRPWDQRTGIPHFDNKWRIEETVRGLRFSSHVILRPVFFMENLLAPFSLQGSTLAWALGPDTKLQMIAVEDIGWFGARAFTDAADLNGREIDLAGDVRTMPEAAEILTEALNRPIAFAQTPLEQVRQYQLKINYRTTQQIRRFADSLFISSEADAEGDLLTRDAVSILNGPEPRIAGFDSVAAEVAGLSEWLEKRISEGIKPKEIAIFGRIESVLHNRAEPALDAVGLKGQLLSDEEPATDNNVSIGTMHRAKGLEFKAVAIVGCDLGLLPLRSVLDGLVDSVERDQFVEQERNLLYVALTRAREQVFVTHTARPSDYLKGPLSPSPVHPKRGRASIQ
jgi:ATP-dependent exoDNAse (exonuclease V) beta subunit